MPASSEIPAKFEQLLRGVNHGRAVTNKYPDFERFLADILDVQADDVYTTYVGATGRFGVRLTQSKRARRSRLIVVLVPSQLDNQGAWAYFKNAASNFTNEENPGSAVLFVCDGPDGWAPRWALEPEVLEYTPALPRTLSRIGSWFPSFELCTYPYTPPGAPLSAQEQQLLQAISGRPGVTEQLYRLEPSFFARLIEDDVSARDVVAIAHRRTVVERFRRLLEDPDFFTAEAEPFGGRKEAVWQNLLEENPWILGVSLAGQLLTSWSKEKLEQVVAGFSISGPGKRADALMRTSGRIRAMVFAEIKHHETELLSTRYRTGCWAPSSELVGAVVQIQQNIHLANRQINGRLADTGDNGIETGEFTYMVRPRSFVILGSLDQLRSPQGVHRNKYESFELYRRNLYEPDIMTFDELLARAEWHVKAKD